MRYDFDTPINRRNTFSFKWDCDMDYFGRDDVIPMWVADMDFACAPCIVEAVQKRAAHPVYGYGVRQKPYYDAVMGWLKKRATARRRAPRGAASCGPPAYRENAGTGNPRP